MPTINVKGEGALKEARSMILDKTIEVFSTRAAPRYALTAKLRTGGMNRDVHIGKTNSKLFPVGTRVFDSHSGAKGIVVGYATGGGFKGRFGGSTLLIRTKAAREPNALIYVSGNDLDVLAEAKQRGWTEREATSRLFKTERKQSAPKKASTRKSKVRRMPMFALRRR
jgi:hypothetical protein